MPVVKNRLQYSLFFSSQRTTGQVGLQASEATLHIQVTKNTKLRARSHELSISVTVIPDVENIHSTSAEATKMESITQAIRFKTGDMEKIPGDGSAYRPTNGFLKTLIVRHFISKKDILSEDTPEPPSKC